MLIRMAEKKIAKIPLDYECPGYDFNTFEGSFATDNIKSLIHKLKNVVEKLEEIHDETVEHDDGRNLTIHGRGNSLIITAPVQLIDDLVMKGLASKPVEEEAEEEIEIDMDEDTDEDTDEEDFETDEEEEEED